MTYKEAKFINERAFLVDACGNTDEYLIEANHMAVEALEHQDKYRWHDLRKDASDLPTHTKDVLCAFWNGTEYAYRICNAKRYTGFDHVRYAKIIAWRYIEPFEEEELC